MLGVAPDDRGLLPDVDVARLRELGTALRERFANNLLKDHLPVDENVARALDGDTGTFWSAPAGSHAATMEVRLAKPATFDHALTMEWLNEGQNIQQYRIEAWQDGHWVTLASSFAIGHEKIDKFPAVTAQRVRLNIVASTGEARIREFQLFSLDASK